MRKGEEKRPYIIWAEHAVNGKHALAGERRLNRAMETARRVLRMNCYQSVWIEDCLGQTVALSIGQRMLDGTMDGTAQIMLLDGVTLPGRFDQATDIAPPRKA